MFICVHPWFIKKVCPEHEEMFDHRAEGQHGQEVQRADEQDRAEQQHENCRPDTGNVPVLSGDEFIFQPASRPWP